MAMPQRDDPPTPSSFAEATDDKWLRRTSTIEAVKRFDALFEYAVMHNDEDEAERLREEPYNPGLAGAFFKCGLIEAWGRIR